MFFSLLAWTIFVGEILPPKTGRVPSALYGAATFVMSVALALWPLPDGATGARVSIGLAALVLAGAWVVSSNRERGEIQGRLGTMHSDISDVRNGQRDLVLPHLGGLAKNAREDLKTEVFSMVQTLERLDGRMFILAPINRDKLIELQSNSDPTLLDDTVARRQSDYLTECACVEIEFETTYRSQLQVLTKRLRDQYGIEDRELDAAIFTIDVHKIRDMRAKLLAMTEKL
ncbi:MAG TPA: hypothetical protein VGZ00_02180 [Candidatus Baltobacteraceae bacterium]|nr:hypothetical protein [Candidatus Baltobacteraceae bacterium]